MGLFSDNRTSEWRDWLEYDGKLVHLLETNKLGIEIKAKLAQEKLRSELIELFIQQMQVAPLTARTRIDSIVVTSELKRWHCLTTLELFYGDLGANSANRAHLEQALYYKKEAIEAKGLLLGTGIAYVLNPVPRPPMPMLERVLHAGQAGVLRGKIAYRTEKRELSSGSDLFLLECSETEAIRVGPVETPQNVLGWELFLGFEENDLRQVNSEPLSGASSFVASPSSLAQAATISPLFGQSPDGYWVVDRMLWS